MAPVLHRVPNAPDVAVIVPTFERPAHLRRTLASIDAQVGNQAIEVVVTDDGSTGETSEVVREYAKSCPFPVAFVTHDHAGFQLARCRNEGVAASRAEYLIFIDGDCVIPPDFVREHLRRRRRGIVLSSDVARLPKDASERVTLDRIAARDIRKLIPVRERLRLRWSRTKARFYELTRHPRKPRLFGGANSLWRDDYLAVNGYDENFTGWGAEDDDLRDRLKRRGIRIRSTPPHVAPLHLWHPPHATNPASWRDGNNVKYLLRPGKLRRCVRGFRKLDRSEVLVRVLRVQIGADELAVLPTSYRYVPLHGSGHADVEIALFPGTSQFTNHADCRVLVILEPSASVAQPLETQADYVVRPPAKETPGTRAWTPRSELEKILDHVCGFRLQHDRAGGTAEAA